MSLPEPYYADERVTIYCADNADVLPYLSGVDLVFTSPPYNLGVTAGGGFGHYVNEVGMRQRGGGGKWTGGELAHGYGGHGDAMPVDEYESWQRDVLTLCWRTLSERGAIFYNHKPRVQAGSLWLPLRLNPGLPVRQIVIWARPGGMNFAPTHYVPTHEWIMVLAGSGFRLKSKGASGIGDVWSVAPERETVRHPAPFPVGLPARAIETTGPSLVVDPHMGAGATVVAARDAGAHAIGVDNHEPYCAMAVDRLRQQALDFGGAA